MSKKGTVLASVGLFWAFMLVSQYEKGYVDYLYQGYAAIQDQVAQYSDSDTFYVGDNTHPIYRYMMFWVKEDRFICIPASSLQESLHEIKGDVRSTDALVYIKIIMTKNYWRFWVKNWGYPVLNFSQKHTNPEYIMDIKSN